MAITDGARRARVRMASRLRRILTGSLLVAGLAATIAVGTYWTASAMQTGLAAAARTVLDAQQLSATVVMSGRDAHVWARTPTERADAIAAVRTVPGVRVVVVGEGEPPARPAIVVTSAEPHPLPSDSRPLPSAAPVTTRATAPRSATPPPPTRTSPTHGPSISMTKEG